MDQFEFIATPIGLIGSLCTIAGFVMKVMEDRRNSQSNDGQKKGRHLR